MPRRQGPPAFQSFLDDNRDRVWRFCLAVAGPSEAEDCFQETFLAALRAYPRLRTGSNLEAWVMTIAHSKAMDAHRGRTKRPRPVAEVPERAGRPHPETDDELWSLVRSLADKQRAAVAYRFVCDLGYADIAQIMSCTQDAARRNVHEGITRLRKEIAK